MKLINSQEFANYKAPTYEGKIANLAELFDRLVVEYRKDPESIIGKPTANWSTFNTAFGGARAGELIVITADTGTGKTTFGMNWAMEMMQMKHRAFLVSLEVSWTAMARMMAQRLIQKQFTKFSKEDMALTHDLLSHLDGYFLDDTGLKPLEYVQKAIQYAAREMGCKFILLDHFDYLLRPNSQSWESAYVIGNMMRTLCATAKETDTTLVLIVHPSKLEQKGIKHREIGMDELKGSSSIKQEADAVLSLYNPNPEEHQMVLRFQKIRDPGHGMYRDSFIRFQFNPESLSYSEVSVAPEWGQP